MEKRLNSKSTVLFIVNRILSLAAICLFYQFLDGYYQEAWINLSFGVFDLFVVDILSGVFMGILLGWFLCDTISITGNKYMNIVLIVVLAILASYKIIFFTVGNMHGMEIIRSGSVGMILFDLGKIFQRVLGMCIFFMVYEKIKANLLKRKAPAPEEQVDERSEMNP